MPSDGKSFAPGTYRFTVKSTEQAVALIREKLGPNARVVSVRAITETGWKKFFGGSRLEVIAQIDAPGATSGNALNLTSADLADPGATASDASDVGGVTSPR